MAKQHFKSVRLCACGVPRVGFALCSLPAVCGVLAVGISLCLRWRGIFVLLGIHVHRCMRFCIITKMRTYMHA